MTTWPPIGQDEIIVSEYSEGRNHFSAVNSSQVSESDGKGKGNDMPWHVYTCT